MSSIEVIEALCCIVEKCLAVIKDEEQARSIEEEYRKAIGEE